MAIRNEILGGTDWSNGNILFAEDLNDTFNEIVRVVELGY